MGASLLNQETTMKNGFFCYVINKYEKKSQFFKWR